MSPYLAMCLDLYFGALAVLYLYFLGLHAESMILLLNYLRSHGA
jgi:hypothetical protein